MVHGEILKWEEVFTIAAYDSKNLGDETSFKKNDSTIFTSNHIKRQHLLEQLPYLKRLLEFTTEHLHKFHYAHKKRKCFVCS